MSKSCRALGRAWPMCKFPVTFGGGSTMTKDPSGFTFPSAVNSGLKNPSFSHHEYHADSTAIGLYALYWGSSNDLITTERIRISIDNRLLAGKHTFLFSCWGVFNILRQSFLNSLFLGLSFLLLTFTRRSCRGGTSESFFLLVKLGLFFSLLAFLLDY